MDVDDQVGQSSDPSGKLEELSELIVELDAQPLDVNLLKRQVQILASLPMTEELIEATNTLSSLVALEPGGHSPKHLPVPNPAHDRSCLDPLLRTAHQITLYLGYLSVSR